MGGKVGGGGGGWNWAAVDGAVITAARNKGDTHDGSFVPRPRLPPQLPVTSSI